MVFSLDDISVQLVEAIAIDDRGALDVQGSNNVVEFWQVGSEIYVSL